MMYVCSACGAQASKWTGQCANTLEETTTWSGAGKRLAAVNYAGDRSNEIQLLSDVQPDDIQRIATGISEFDRVLGGGLVPGSVTLIGGDPGIGKSTLLLQAVVQLSQQRSTLYITGEESLQQVSLRAHRLGMGDSRVALFAATQLESVLQQAQKHKPAILVIDSIQTIFSEQLQSAPGSVAQVR